MAAGVKEEEEEEKPVPKLPLVMAMVVIFGVLPMLPHGGNNGKLAKLIEIIYRRIGPAGLIGLPAVTLTLEKSAYDSYTAYYGQSIYEAAKADGTPKHGGFPSGGAQLPSFSLIETRREGQPVVFRWLFLRRAAEALTTRGAANNQDNSMQK